RIRGGRAVDVRGAPLPRARRLGGPVGDLVPGHLRDGDRAAVLDGYRWPAMNTRTTGRSWSRPRRVCPEWCARRNLPCPAREGYPGAEHVAVPIRFTVPGAGAVMLTRVRSAEGVERADIRIRATLPTREADARLRLAALLTHLRTLLGPGRPVFRRAAS